MGKGDRRRRQADENRALPVDWIQTRILAPGVLAGLHGEARGITLALVETGCRPSELCNIAPENIFLDEDIPHIHLSRDTMELKTRWQDRRIPLVGVAMEVFRRHPGGFPRYRGKEGTYAATAGRYLKEHGLRPSPRHSLHSFRLSFMDRMIKHGADTELRASVMGYRFDPLPPVFCRTVPLGLCQRVLSAMAFDFDPAIV
jgi:integrase